MIKKNEIKKNLNENYSNIGKIKTVKLLNQDNNSINFIVKTSKDNYVLKKFLDVKNSKKIEKICQILIISKKKKAKVIEPIIRNNGNYVDNRNHFYLMKYYSGKHYSKNILQLKDIARNLAIFHKSIQHVSKKNNMRNNYKYYKILKENELKQIFKKIKNKKIKDQTDQKILKNYSLLISNFKKYHSDNKIKKILFKKQLIHFDVHPKNVIFRKNHVVSILDFHSIGTGYQITDVSFAAFRFSLENTWNPKKIMMLVKLFIDTYTKYNVLKQNQFSVLSYYFFEEVLKRISYILRKKYIENFQEWSNDFEKFCNFLIFIKKFEIYMNQIVK